MAPHVLGCPHCGKRLKFSRPPVAGRRVLCHGCSRAFMPPTQVSEIPWLADAAADDPHPLEVVQRAGAPASAQPEKVPSSVTAPRIHRGLLLAAAAGLPLLLLGSVALAVCLLVPRPGSKREVPALAIASTRTVVKSTSANPLVQPENTELTPAPAPTPPPADSPRDEPAPRLRVDAGPPAPDRPREVPGPKRELAAPARPAANPNWLPPEKQQLVNRAIDRGVEYLKKKQHDNGSWHDRHTTGLAALPGLTLLECGVPADDERVQKAARHVRERAPRFNTTNSPSTTYELSLSLLFLDRLGDPKDKPLIRTIAMRLVAGQLHDGGWTYNLPVLLPENESEILRVLERTARRPRPMEREVQFAKVKKPLERPARLPDPETEPSNPTARQPDPNAKLGPGVARSSKTDQPAGRDSEPLANNPPAEKAAEKKKPAANKAPAGEMEKEKEPDRPLGPAEARKVIKTLPARFQQIPALVAATGEVTKTNPLVAMRWPGDNSNTQFATLALWAARRHGLPVERSLELVAQRFRGSQLADGRWRYNYPNGRLSPVMTGVGLIGLAVGHGLDAEVADKKAVRDARVEAGLKAMGSHVGKRFRDEVGQEGRIVSGRNEMVVIAPINTYFLWTVERVGVLYDVREMGGKDWYRWGVDLLLRAQKADGSWLERGYPGANRPLDVCFALLFLKRANLIADLTKKLDLSLPGKTSTSPEGKPALADRSGSSMGDTLK
jgi:hypothetical protein